MHVGPGADRARVRRAADRAAGAGRAARRARPARPRADREHRRPAGVRVGDRHRARGRRAAAPAACSSPPSSCATGATRRSRWSSRTNSPITRTTTCGGRSALDVGVLAAGFWAAGGVLRAHRPGRRTACPRTWRRCRWSRWWPAACGWRRRRSATRCRAGRSGAADAFALELTGRADAFQAAIRRLAAQHLAEERPSRLTRWLFHRHPSAAERLRLAESFERRG